MLWLRHNKSGIFVYKCSLDKTSRISQTQGKRKGRVIWALETNTPHHRPNCIPGFVSKSNMSDNIPMSSTKELSRNSLPSHMSFLTLLGYLLQLVVDMVFIPQSSTSLELTVPHWSSVQS